MMRESEKPSVASETPIDRERRDDLASTLPTAEPSGALSLESSTTSALITSKENLTGDIAGLREAMDKFERDLTACEEKVNSARKAFDDTISELEKKTSSIKAKVDELNEIFGQTETGRAKSVVRRVITDVPRLLVKILVPEKFKARKSYALVDVLTFLNKLAEKGEAKTPEDERRRASVEKRLNYLKSSVEEIDYEINIFKDLCWLIPADRSSLSAEVVFLSIRKLADAEVIDNDEEALFRKLAAVWEELVEEIDGESLA